MRELAEKLYALLDLEHAIVGVRFIKTKEEFDTLNGRDLQKPITYCQMVRAAMHGHTIKADDSSFRCRSGARVFGINPADPMNSRGENWCRLGLYKDAATSLKVREDLAYSAIPQYGVVLGPLEEFDREPDVVLIATTPYNCMRIVQGYAYHYGMPESVKMIGNQAVCLECTARPYVVQDINVSLLCIGTRHRAHWGDNEMAVGIPIKQFPQVVDGILQTVNIMEDNANKRRIEEGFKTQNIDYPIRYNYNYYKEC